MSERPANITLHIGELILDGIDVSDPAGLQAAVERELTRLISERGLKPTVKANASAASIQVAPGARAETLGAQIASAVYGRLRG